MAYRKHIVTGNGVTTQFPVPFPYLDKSHVKVYLNGVAAVFTWVSSAVIEILPAPTAAQTVTITSNTPKDARLVDFQNGAITDEATFDKDSNQLLYILQETLDGLTSNMSENLQGQLDAANRRIVNVAAPVDGTDAVNKAYADTIINTAQGSADAAAQSASNAATSATNASNSASAAVTSATNASNSASAAATSATNAQTAKTQAEAARDSLLNSGVVLTTTENTFTASQAIEGDALKLRMNDTGTGGKEFAVYSDSGAFNVDYNNGTKVSPQWLNRFAVANDWVTGDVPVRMTVMSAALLNNGLNGAIEAGTGLAVNLVASASEPYIVTAPLGNDALGRPLDYVWRVAVSSLSAAWASLTANSTNYLYCKRTSVGSWSRGFTTLAPVYGYGVSDRPAAPATNQMYFDIVRFKWFIYNGTSWVEQTDGYVFVGEVVTGASSVTSVVNYAVNGYYDSGTFPVNGATVYTKNTNIGAPFTVHLYVGANAHSVSFNHTSWAGAYYGRVVQSQSYNHVTIGTAEWPAWIGSGVTGAGTPYRIVATRRF